MSGKAVRCLMLAACVFVAECAACQPAYGDGSPTAAVEGTAGNHKPAASNGFLSESWRDTFTCFGVFGVFATLTGLIFAWYQIWKATTATQAATNAALSAMNESAKRYNNHVVSRAKRIMSEASLYVNGANWTCACLRLTDLVDHFSEIADNDLEWRQLAGRLQTIETAFARLSNATTCSASLRRKWIALRDDVTTKLNKFLIPFATPQGGRQ